METQVSLDEKIRSTFGKALLDALSENTKVAGKVRSNASAQPQAVNIKEKRYNIMLVSLEGYPGAYASLDAEALDQVQKDFYEIVEASALAHRGSIVKSTESTCFITFDTSTDVLRAGLKIESTIARYNKDNDPINTKIVINTDEVVSEEWGELFKKFMNRVIQKEKISNGAEKAEKLAEPSRISVKREVSWGTAKSENGARMVSDSTSAMPESTTRTITEKRMANAPRTSVKVVTHKRELPEGAQQYPPHFIHSDRPRNIENGADWSHRIFLVVVTLLICGAGYFAFKAAVRHYGDRLEPIKGRLSESASLSSSFIQSKFFSGGKNFTSAPAVVSQVPAVAPPLTVSTPAPVPAPVKQSSPLVVSVVPQTQVEAKASETPVADATTAKPGIPRFETAQLQKQFADDSIIASEKIARYRAVIRNYPGSVQAHASQVEIGKIRIQLGQTALAKEIFNELLAKTPVPELNLLAESQYQLGVAHWKDKDSASAKECFERVMKSYPQATTQVQESQKMLAVLKQESLKN